MNNWVTNEISKYLLKNIVPLVKSAFDIAKDRPVASDRGFFRDPDSFLRQVKRDYDYCVRNNIPKDGWRQDVLRYAQLRRKYGAVKAESQMIDFYQSHHGITSDTDSGVVRRIAKSPYTKYMGLPLKLAAEYTGDGRLIGAANQWGKSAAIMKIAERMTRVSQKLEKSSRATVRGSTRSGEVSFISIKQ